jgi:hypothetical protein
VSWRIALVCGCCSCAIKSEALRKAYKMAPKRKCEHK